MASLNPTAWIRAAGARLADHGVDQVRVELLAKDLKVSKGSFYWHFADRAALLEAVLELWEREATSGIIDEIDAVQAGPADRLWALMRRVFDAPPGVDALEAALRAWARRDDEAKRVVRRVDRRRVGFVKRLLVEAGVQENEARRRADLLYSTLIGEFILRSYGRKPIPTATLRSLFTLLLAEGVGG